MASPSGPEGPAQKLPKPPPARGISTDLSTGAYCNSLLRIAGSCCQVGGNANGMPLPYLSDFLVSCNPSNQSDETP